MKRLCIQWPRLGPYHLARLDATHRFLTEQGVELVALETAGRDATYDWREERGETALRRVRVFPDRVYDTIPPAEMFRDVTATLDRLQPDAVTINSYSHSDAHACLAWCRRHGRVAVVITDTKADDAPRTAWREYLKALLVRQFDAALLSGSPHRNYFEQLGFPADAIFLGCSVVDNAFFRDGAAEARRQPQSVRGLPGLEQSGPFFLASNRFVPRKNVDGLLRAYAAYRRTTETPWRLVLLGDGPERVPLEALVAAERIGGVTLAGFRQIEELPAYYGLACVFVHPALQEQWGLVVNEAMASGLPVLVSRRTGCATDLVEEGVNGFCFDAEDTDQLARLMQRIAAPETDRDAMGRRSEEIIAAWSPERFAHSLWQAVQVGRGRAGRPFDPRVRALLWMLRAAARDTKSFHAIKT